jgi:hypothetical protein
VGVSQVWTLARTEERLDPAVIRQTIRLLSHVQSRRCTYYAILVPSHIIFADHTTNTFYETET